MKESCRTFQNKVIPDPQKNRKKKSLKKKVLRNRNLFSDLLGTIKMVHDV